ncbi:hypothetical protein M1555_02525 [Patescibacteria group bacterium]|nr:hypothetical protein [Patescibacteria group bacterium]
MHLTRAQQILRILGWAGVVFLFGLTLILGVHPEVTIGFGPLTISAVVPIGATTVVEGLCLYFKKGPATRRVT